MADIGTLVVKMAADSAQMRSELDRVKKEVKGTDSVLSQLTSNFKLLGGVAAGISFGALINQALQAASALNDTATKTGISIDALQRLQFAAGLSGGSLEGVSGAVARMQKALIEAGEGSKQARAALDQLGLSASQVLALSPDKQFEAVAVAIAAIEDPAARTTAAMDLFGKSGAELVPTLVAIGTNAEEISAQLSSIGGPVSEEAIAKVDTLGDQLDILKTAGKNTAIELAALASVVLGPVLQATNSWISSLRILVGGGGELERLERKLEILRDAREFKLPFLLNLGYVEGGNIIMGPRALEQAIAQVGREIDLLKTKSQFEPVMAEIPINIPEPKIPDFSKKPELSPEQKRAKAATAFEQELQLQMSHQQMVEMLQQQHLDNLISMDMSAMAQRIQVASDLEFLRMDIAQAFGLQLLDFEAIKNQSMISLAGELFTTLAAQNSTLFKVQQAFAIANAVINTAEGVTRALTLPFPANLAAAAKVAVAGAIQIAKIKATNPGGSASVTQSGLSGGTTNAANRTAPAGNAQQAQEPQQKIAQVVIQGSVFSSRETADWLIGQLSEAINDRDVVFINGNSRQAGLISGAA
jgi:hypothetical protein